MKRLVLIGALVAGLVARAEWRMFERRLGLFVHWGIYSVNGYHEQERMRRQLSRADYETAVAGFDAANFRADDLVAAARSAGADYIVVTAKHHDGFCLWETATTDFNAAKSPAGRDLLKEIAAACRRQGVKLGLYYSNPDWHQPNAYNDKSTHQVPPEAGDEPDSMRYLAYVKAQIKELLSNYGEIVCLFWDIPPKIEDASFNELARQLQPGILIDDRGWSKGDYSTPERGIPPGAAFTNLTEACDSVGAQSWGYRSNEDYRTVGYLTRSIDRILSMGGNYLLNVGPKADGTLPEESRLRLAKVGAWYAKTRESYRGVETVPGIVADENCFVTRRGETIFLHYPKGLEATGGNLRPLNRLPQTATLLNTGVRLPCELTDMPSDYKLNTGKVLHVFGIPADDLANESVVIRLDF